MLLLIIFEVFADQELFFKKTVRAYVVQWIHAFRYYRFSWIFLNDGAGIGARCNAVNGTWTFFPDAHLKNMLCRNAESDREKFRARPKDLRYIVSLL